MRADPGVTAVTVPFWFTRRTAGSELSNRAPHWLDASVYTPASGSPSTPGIGVTVWPTAMSADITTVSPMTSGRTITGMLARNCPYAAVTVTRVGAPTALALPTPVTLSMLNVNGSLL